MILGAIIAFCLLILVLAFLLPRASWWPQRGGQRFMSLGGRGAGKAPGKAGKWARKPFDTSNRAIGKSGSAGRRGRSKMPF